MKRKELFDQLKLTPIANLLLRFEWVWIAGMILAFWHRSPPFRDQYVYLLGFAIPFYFARWVTHGRLITRTPLDVTFLIFIIASIYNFSNAPISRADYWVLLCRPFLGFLIIYFFIEHVREHQQIRYLIFSTTLMGLFIGSLALVASQWGASDKSNLFAFIIDYLPVLDYRQVLPDMQLSFNPNEVAGALAYFCPFLLAVTIGEFRSSQTNVRPRHHAIIHSLTRWGALIGFMIVATALFLGQSRFALAGVFVGLLIVILFTLPNWKVRTIGLVIWGFFLMIEIMIVTNVLPLKQSNPTETGNNADTTTVLRERDERSLSTRFELWERALRMVQDYPTTGAGMSTYRALVMREEYMIPLYEGRRFGPPHAHNAFFQLGADLGVVGLLLFIAWYGIVGWMVYRLLPIQNQYFTIMTIGITGSILAYMGYGIGDTITLWDRFSFLHWWFIGLIVSLYILERNHHRETITQS